MVDRPAEATSRLWCEIGGQWRYRLVVVAGIVGEFDGDRLGRALRYGAVQLLDRPLGLDALVEPYEADTLRQACRGADVGETHKITLVIANCVLGRFLSFLFCAFLSRPRPLIDHRSTDRSMDGSIGRSVGSILASFFPGSAEREWARLRKERKREKEIERERKQASPRETKQSWSQVRFSFFRHPLIVLFSRLLRHRCDTLMYVLYFYREWRLTQWERERESDYTDQNISLRSRRDLLIYKRECHDPLGRLLISYW